jgi:hypothetical protein
MPPRDRSNRLLEAIGMDGYCRLIRCDVENTEVPGHFKLAGLNFNERIEVTIVNLTGSIYGGTNVGHWRKTNDRTHVRELENATPEAGPFTSAGLAMVRVTRRQGEVHLKRYDFNFRSPGQNKRLGQIDPVKRRDCRPVAHSL